MSTKFSHNKEETQDNLGSPLFFLTAKVWQCQLVLVTLRLEMRYCTLFIIKTLKKTCV